MVNKKLKPGVFYYWQDTDRIIGVMRIVKDTFDDLFGYGFMIEDNPYLKEAMEKRGKTVKDKDFSSLNKKRAISQVKINLANVYNAIMIHGKGVLDKTGNINYKILKRKERELQHKPVGGIYIDINVTHPFTALKDIHSKEITINKAAELNLI